MADPDPGDASDELPGPAPPEAALLHEIIQSQARALRRMTTVGALVLVGTGLGGFAALGLGLVGLGRSILALSAIVASPLVILWLRPARARLWSVSGPPLPPIRPALDEGDALAFDANLDRALFRKPRQIVWGYAQRRGGLLPCVVVGLSSGVRYAIVLDAKGCDRVLGVLARIAFGAEIGFSEEREALYLQNPKERPRLETRPQIVGARCPGCGEKMLTEQGASLCERCNCPVHEGCLAGHLREAHRDVADHVYR
jgi:hypothetical protein